jgi:hypothetical protein
MANYNSLSAADYVYFDDGSMAKPIDPDDGVDFRLKGYMHLNYDVSKGFRFYSRFMPPGAIGSHSPIATAWCVSGDWEVFMHGISGHLAIWKIARKDKPMFTFPQVMAMLESQELNGIPGFEDRYKDELLGYMRMFVDDNIEEFMSE